MFCPSQSGRIALMKNPTIASGVVASLLLVGACSTATAADIGLYQWGFNVDGGVYSNGFTTPDDITDVPGLDSSSFDVGTGLGTLIYSVDTPGSHSFVAYFDSEIDVSNGGFNNENGSTAGTLVAGQSWEMDEPFDSDIFDHFYDDALTDTNGVGTGSFPNGTDVAMAMGFAFSLLDDQIATVTLDLAETLQTSAFRLIQTDDQTGASVQLTGALSIRTQGVPVPGTVALIALGLLGLGRLRSRGA
jgi:hypothetical protein